MGLSGILPRPRKRTSTSEGAMLGQVIAFANQKGGVAKTTTTLNLAVAFREHGFEVLTVDLDPQGNLTMSQGMDPDQVERSMYDVLVHSMPVEDVIHRAEVDVAVSSIDLAGAELALSSMIGRERALEKALSAVKENYDYVLIDTPPSLGLLTINALVASDHVIVPVQCEYLSLRGLVDRPRRRRARALLDDRPRARAGEGAGERLAQVRLHPHRHAAVARPADDQCARRLERRDRSCPV